MQRVIMKSKIHRATVTRVVVDFVGSCGIAPELMRAGAFCAPSGDRAGGRHNRIREQAAIA